MAALTGRGRGNSGVPGALGLAAAFALGLWVGYVTDEPRDDPVQPIAFSHRVHATERGIDCRFCHAGVDRSPYAGLPPVATCISCHRAATAESEGLRALRGYYERREPIPWVRVFDVPDHVYFTHRVHASRGLECRACHGDVARADRLRAPRRIRMEFCIDCHAARGASRDCVACHR